MTLRNLTFLSALVVLAAPLFSNARTSESETDPTVVSSVDFNRYAGDWYEIAHAPTFFQRNCIRSTARYEVLTSDSVSVHNVCIKKDGTTSDIRGTATVTDPNIPAKLKVKFNFFARGDYWITELDSDYQWAVVSAPKKKSLFILSRVAPMDSVLLSQILTTLAKKGFNTQELIFDQY
jgi:apolipoprotein D and lipocalin family protein